MSDATPVAAGLAHERAAPRTVARTVDVDRALRLGAPVCKTRCMCATPSEAAMGAGSAP
jgi:hypothetical protein